MSRVSNRHGTMIGMMLSVAGCTGNVMFYKHIVLEVLCFLIYFRSLISKQQ